MATSNDKLAVLIDADNAQASTINELLSEVARYGTATVKRAYGDWTLTHLKGWKDTLNKFAIQPMQQFSYTTGKNATDASLIIDAMDLVHSGNLDGFCLVSSDSDFTRLATRIRESGLTVYGFGEKKTPQPFVAACNKFVYTEILKSAASTPPQESAADERLKDMIKTAVTATQKENGWASLATVGSMLQKNSPSFDARNYGYQKLGELVRGQPYIEVKDVSVGDGSSNVHIHVRLKW